MKVLPLYLFINMKYNISLQKIEKDTKDYFVNSLSFLNKKHFL